MKDKKIWKSLLALLCVATMLVGQFEGFGVIAAANTSNIITFSDFGLDDQTVASNTTLQGTLTGHDSFDGLTFHGYASFSGNSDAAVLKFGDKIDVFQQGGCMYVRYNDGSEKYITFEGYETYNQEIEIQLGFVYSGSDVELTFKVDDNEAQTATLSGMASSLTTNLSFYAPGSITIKSVEKAVVEDTSNIITFSDFGLDDQTVAGRTDVTGTLQGHSSFDGLTFHGYVSFSGNSDAAVLKFGDKIDVFQQGDCMYVRYNDGTEKYITVSGYPTYNQEIEIQLSFVYSGDDVELTFKVDDNEAQTATLSGMASSLTTNLSFYAPGSITIKSVEKAVVEDTTNIITFSDFGLDDQTVASNTTLQGTLTGHDSFDGLTFHGYASFSGNSDLAVLKFGDKIDVFQQGGCMYVRYNDGSEKYITFGGYETYNQEIEIQLGFVYSGSDVELTFKVDDNEAQTATLSGMASSLTTNLSFYAPGSITIKSVEKAVVEDTSNIITFSDFGLDDQTVAGRTDVTGTLQGHSSFDGLTFHGYASFSGNSDLAVLKFGDKIDVFQQGDCMYVRYNDGTEKYITVSGYPTYNQEIEIQLSFVYSGDDVELTFKVDDNEAQTATLSGMASSLTTNLSFYAPGSITIKSVENGNGGTDVPEEPTYTELTFKDYGFDDEVVTSTITKSSPESVSLTDMNGVAISGTVSFANNSDYNWIRIAAKDESTGIRIFQQGDGIWVEDCTGKGNGFIFSKTNTELGISNGSKVPFRMTFDYASNGDVTLNLWLNDIALGEKVVEGYADYLGVGITVKGTADNLTTINPVKEVSWEDDNKEVTFRDWGLLGQSVPSSTAVTATGAPADSLDGLALVGYVTLPVDGDSYIRIGGKDDEALANSIYYQGGAIRFYDATGANKGEMLIFEDSVAKIKLGLENTLQDTRLKLRVAFNYDGDNVTIKATLNDTWTKAVTVEGYASYLGTKLCVRSAANGVLTFESIEVDKGISESTYNLAEGPYLLTSCGNLGDTTIVVNDSNKQAGDTLTTPGTYTIKRNDDNVLSTHTITLYTLGDVNGDGSINDTDITVMKSVLKADSITTLQKKAGDLNNDGVISNTDLKLLKDIVNANVTGDIRTSDILKKYYANSLVYDCLTGDGNGNEVMPISGFFGEKSSVMSSQMMQDIKDSGINLLNALGCDYFGDKMYIQNVLKLAEEKGIGIYVNDAKLNYLELNSDGETVASHTPMTLVTDYAKRIGEYSYYNMFLGIHLMDEPMTAIYQEGLADNHYRNLKYYTDMSKQLNLYTNFVGYMNAPCMYISSSWAEIFPGVSDQLYQEGKDNYNSLLQDMIDGGNTKVLSFDDYAFDDDTIDSGIKKFLASMDSVRTKAGTDMPFWGFVQAGNVGYRVPTQTMTDWQVNVLLAFGAKGVEYFPVTQTTITVEGTEYTENGLFDANGNQTEYYEQVKNANDQIKAVDSILMKSSNDGIIALGTNAREYVSKLDVCLNTTESNTSYKKVNSITTSDTTNGTLAGCFDYQGKAAIYLVNYAYEGSTAQTVTLKTDGQCRYRIISADAAQCVENGLTGFDSNYEGTITVSIAPGKAVLVVVDEEDVNYTVQEFSGSEVAEFKTNNTAPELIGYVFAGWFTSTDISTEANMKQYYLQGDVDVNATYYAKFVDENLLSVKVQLQDGTDSEKTASYSSEVINLRFVTTVDNLAYSRIGFAISNDGTNFYSYDSKTVYEALMATDGTNILSYTPSVFYNYGEEQSVYFATLNVTGFNATQYDMPITVRPYWVTLDGTTVYGVERTLQISDGFAS